MAKTLKTNNKKPKNGKLSRKQLRKEKRKEKKSKRNDYFTKKRNQAISSQLMKISEKLTNEKLPVNNHTSVKEELNDNLRNEKTSQMLSIEQIHKKEKMEQKKIQKDMSKQRKEQLLKANEKEDLNIRKLEKQLKLHKRKTKAMPKSFSSDGLDYLLEVCNPEYMENAASAEQDLINNTDNFEEDLALMTGKVSKLEKKKKSEREIMKTVNSEEEADSEDFESFLNEDEATDENADDEESNVEESDSTLSDLESDPENYFDKENSNSKENLGKDGQNIKNTQQDQYEHFNSDDDMVDIKVRKGKNLQSKRKPTDVDSEPVLLKKQKSNSSESDTDANSASDLDQGVQSDKEVWEDIYGRLRSKEGAVIENKEVKYIPPAIRAKMEANESEHSKRNEKLGRLRKQLKGLLNRLAENNMHNIASQIEGLYMNNSRNDMNETLTMLILDSLISTVLTPERLLMEHILLIAILHANVGTEIGAHFLQAVSKKFSSAFMNTSSNVEDKTLDNIVTILAQLYNFKVFDAKLLYEILQKLTDSFDEKNVECILHILRSVGFSLRKDDPLALKNLILELQKQAASASKGKINNSRVKFLLDVLLAIKNNNVTKIPNYDISYSEHLKKIMKGFIRKGNYVAPLNIALEDLLNADQRGKWWVVGSAWTGKTDDIKKVDQTSKSSSNFSQQLVKIAKQQRMNTDTRRDIFCIIMSAEDYLDAFEKLLKLGLKHQQEREIIHVILHCCLQEKTFNPFYAILAQKFCEFDRRFQMTIKCSIWDKLKTLSSHSGAQISSLAKLLIYLFIQKGLPISTLKIIEFGELDKVTLRLTRQILIGILLHDDVEAMQAVFTKVALSDQLKMFRESLRLFIHHFLLRNLKEGTVPEDQRQTLENRAKLVEKMLAVKENKLRW